MLHSRLKHFSILNNWCPLHSEFSVVETAGVGSYSSVVRSLITNVGKNNIRSEIVRHSFVHNVVELVRDCLTQKIYTALDRGCLVMHRIRFCDGVRALPYRVVSFASCGICGCFSVLPKRLHRFLDSCGSFCKMTVSVTILLVC